METMDTTSHWHKSAVLPRFPALDQTLTVDVAIVGAGITGITTAWLLKKAGFSVALLERERCANIDTGHTTAHLTAVTDLRLHELIRSFGAETAKATWDAGMTALQRIQAIATEEDIACGFALCPGYLHTATSHEDPELLQHEAKCARDLGIAAEYRAAVPLFHRPGVEFPGQAIFHPLRYLGGLLERLPGPGCHVFEETAALEIEKNPRCLRTRNGRVNYGHLILATHNPLAGNAGLLRATYFQTKLFLYTSYALGARLPGRNLPPASFWDTADPYHYLRIEQTLNGPYAIYGGEDHKTGQVTDTVAVYASLEKKLRDILPEAEVDARWSGQVIETKDGLPYIGEFGERQFIATGFSGNGMTFGTLGAMMAVDAVQGRENAWQKIFLPTRKKVRGATLGYLRENKDFPVRLIRDRFARPEAESLREIPAGEGRILRMGRRKVAAHRDARGRVQLCSAICTHLQCVVAWNTAEQTWDCPCHGSRFHPDGRVISGPAEEPLTPLSPSTGRPLRPRRAAPAQPA
jgi:glycine/D-amino acid oxidase-like deaminating enzyme/nitrite reductase/ring-hydroxylating ferredoxin subunit